MGSPWSLRGVLAGWCAALLLAGALPVHPAGAGAPAVAPQPADAAAPRPTGRAPLSDAIAVIVAGGPPAGVDDEAWRRTVELYESSDYAPQWVSDMALRPPARALVGALVRAPGHGLRRADYPLQPIADALEAAHGAPGGAREGRLALADVLLTGALAAYADDLLTGRLDPSRVEPAWHIRSRAEIVDSAMRRTLRADRAADVLAALVPQEGGYLTLMRALARYRAIAARGGWPRLPAGPTLWPGDSGAAVPLLRERLHAEDYLAARGGDASSRYDAALVDAVARFQARHGLAVDSAVGPRTRAALNVPAEGRAAQIAANLERYRWLPRELGDRRIVVNIPAFRLDAYDEGRHALSMRVVVGRELADRRTPVFSDSMSYVQFGPYWNVPRGIAVEEILPQARRDRGYLARHDYEIVHGWGDDAPVVDPWRLSDAALMSSRYRVRQRPGPRNALGRVKFMFPNDFAVYLHDTPSRALFDERRRAHSHGCVRVADPAALARFVLAHRPDWTAVRIRRTLETGERVRVNLRDKIPVYLIYLTAFEREGEVAFREDLYDMDRVLRDALGGAAPSPGSEALARRLQRLVAAFGA